MTTHGWISVTACTGELALAILALRLGRRSRLSLPLAFFSLDLFFWNFAALAYNLSGQSAWHWLDVATSPLAVPLALHFVLVFVGRRQSLAWTLWLCYGAFGLLGLAAGLAFFFSWAQKFSESPVWAKLFLVGIVPVFIFGVTLLAFHLRRTGNEEEKVRSRLLLAAFSALAFFGSIELLASLGESIPHAGNIGVLACNILMAWVALRFRLFDQTLSWAAVLGVLALATLGVGAYGVVLQFSRANTAAVALGLTTGALALVAVTLQVSRALIVRRQRLEQLVALGRFSAQLAHNLKNPLAALKGAAQYLKEELRLRGSLERQSEFVDLILEQIERVHRTLEDYQRLGRVEPILERLQLNALIQEVLSLSGCNGASKVNVELDLESDLPSCPGDSRLLAEALENLVRNAFEAMPSGGTLKVCTGRDPVERQLVVTVEDSGLGMDARTRERAFEEFFTTKANGTGMGLAFVRRVVEAHHGHLSVYSREGRGTSVQLHLPIQ